MKNQKKQKRRVVSKGNRGPADAGSSRNLTDEKSLQGMSKSEVTDDSVSKKENVPARKHTVNLPPLESLLKAGVHFGHQTNKWHPKMSRYIYSQRGGVHIIDLSQTLKRLEEAQDLI